MLKLSAPLLGLWLVLVLCVPGPGAVAAEQPQHLLARVRSEDCKTTTRAAIARAAGAAAPVVGLSESTASSVKVAASAVGLEYVEDLPVPCWVVLRAATQVATEAAIKALLAPPGAGDAASTAAAATGIRFDFVRKDRLKRKFGAIPGSSRSTSSDSGSSSSSKTSGSGLLGGWHYSGPIPREYIEAKLGRKGNATRRPHPAYNHTHGHVPNRIRTRGFSAGGIVPGAAAGMQAAAGAKAPLGLPSECSSSGSCSLWNLNRIRAPQTWAALGSLIPFAQITRKAMIIDDGIDPAHYDLKNQMDRINSVTFCKATSNTPGGGVEASNAQHGSHVSGTAAGDWGNGDTRGIAGIAGPMQNQLVSCNIFGSTDSASDSDIIKCLAYAVSTKSHFAINLSLGGVDYISEDQLYKDAFDAFCKADGIALVAAGNGETVNGQNRAVDIANAGNAQDYVEAEYPAYMANYFPNCVIAVANIKQGDQLAASSNYGKLVKLAAPGTDINSDVNSNGGGWNNATWAGTSMATPHVTGSVILLRNAFPQASNKQVVNCLVTSADMTVTANRYGTIGGGVLNLLSAYNCMKALFGDPTGGSGGGGNTVDCTVQAVPECVLAASGFVATLTSPCSNSSAYCLTVGSYVCSYKYKDSNYACSTGTCSGSSSSCTPVKPGIDCSTRQVPVCVDAASGFSSSSSCRTNSTTYCEQANISTYCSYKYLGPSSTCSADGVKCSGSSPTCPASPSTDCTSLMLPLCVNRYTGSFSTSACTTNSTLYCEKLSAGGFCSYKYYNTNHICGTDGTKCNGASANCPWSPPPGKTCSGPPTVSGATWDVDCAISTLPGDTCTATCDDYYYGFNGSDSYYGDNGSGAYSVECLADGSWGAVQVVGDGCGSGGGSNSSTICADCSANGLCSEEAGCSCSSSQSGSGGDYCTCAEELGFTSFTYLAGDGSPPESYCGWSLDFVAGGTLKAYKGARGRLDFKVGTVDAPICVATKVVDLVELGADLYDCPRDVTFVQLPGTNRILGSELCIQRTKVSSYVLAVGRPKNSERSAGKCRDLVVHTTDFQSHVLTLQYRN